MFKTKLNQYCQTKSVNIPHYRVMKEGPDHRPRFTAEVFVNGVSFRTAFSRSIKEAQNHAAKLAFLHFAGHSDLRGSSDLRGRSDMRGRSASTSIQSQRQRQHTQGTSSVGANHLTEDNNFPRDMRHLYKYQLQIHAQKRNLQLPVYSVESVGPCYASQFKCGVIFEGKCFETKELFHTAKEAEYAAAKVALDSITPVETNEEDPFIYKNLLQEILQKEHSCLPKYATVQAGKPHVPRFMSVVEVRGETFRGQEAHTKKQAELNAAKVAYIALKERKYLTWTGRSRKYDKLVGATNHIMEVPGSSATKPVFGACNSSRTVRTDAQPFSDKQYKCEGEGPKGTPNPFTRIDIAATSTITGSIQNLKAASLVPGPISYPKTPPSTVVNSQLVGPPGSDRTKMKRKMLVFPSSDSSSPEDVKHVIQNSKGFKISPGPGPGPGPGPEATNILGQLPSPDPCECALHSKKRWIALIPKEET